MEPNMRGMPYDSPLLKFEKPMLVSSKMLRCYIGGVSLCIVVRFLFAWIFNWVRFVPALVINRVLPKNC